MKKIEEIIEFIEITGEKCIIMHQERGAYVVMKIEDYKEIVIKSKKDEESSLISTPDTDVRLYEIPRVEDKKDIYYPEPMDENPE